MANVDATVEKDLNKQYGVRGVPCVLLFIYGEPTKYTDERKAANVISWVQTQLNEQWMAQ